MKILKQLSEIAEGYSNLIFENPEVEALAEKRLNECLTCDERSDKDNHPDKVGTLAFCKNCGCALLAKSRSTQSSCPLGKW